MSPFKNVGNSIQVSKSLIYIWSMGPTFVKSSEWVETKPQFRKIWENTYNWTRLLRDMKTSLLSIAENVRILRVISFWRFRSGRSPTPQPHLQTWLCLQVNKDWVLTTVVFPDSENFRKHSGLGIYNISYLIFSWETFIHLFTQKYSLIISCVS